MGITSKRLSQDSLDGILESFHTFAPTFVESGRENKDPLSVMFERFWQDLTKDGRYLKHFKLLKKSIGRKVCHVAGSIQ